MKQSTFLLVAGVAFVSTAAFSYSGPPSVPEIPSSLIPWLVGGASGGAIWLRSIFRKK